MTPLPKRRISTRRKGKRRASQKLQKPSLTRCFSCGRPKQNHLACPFCGRYKAKK